jgi:hypothetical protein
MIESIEDEKLPIAYAMIRFGGSFARALGKALLCADVRNTRKIKATWPDYWEEYTRMAGYLKDDNE